MHSVYSAAPADWDIEHTVVKPYTSAEMHSVYSVAPADWDIGHSLEESYTSAEIQSVYFTTSDSSIWFRPWTVITIMMLYKNMKAIIHTSDGDPDFFDVIAEFEWKIFSTITFYNLPRLLT